MLWQGGWEQARETFREFTQYYLKARYSREELSQDVVPLVDSLWRGSWRQSMPGGLERKKRRILQLERKSQEHPDRTSSEDGGGG